MRHRTLEFWIACTLAPATPTLQATETAQPVAATQTPEANLPNPASVYCEAQDHTLEIRTASDGSQHGVCVFQDGSECDEWAFYRGECGPASAQVEPTPLPTLAGGYTSWLSYTQADYAFSFRYPSDWVVEPDANPVSTLYGHALFVRPADETTKTSLRVVFRRNGAELLLWPTGVGEGEFVQRDIIPFGDGMLKRDVLVCDGGDQSV